MAGVVHVEAHQVAWIVAGVFAVGAVAVSLRLIVHHNRHFTQPKIQRKILGILWMVPIYAIDSWLSLRFKDASIYLDMFRDCYEGYVIYLFLGLMISFLGESTGGDLDEVMSDMTQVSHTFPFNYCYAPIPIDGAFIIRCKRGTMQFVILKPFLTIVAAILESYDAYGQGTMDLSKGYVYISFLQNLSITYAFYVLVLFYLAFKVKLKPYHPVPKFLCVKAVLFLSFWQSVVLAGLAYLDIVKSAGSWSVDNVSTGIQNMLICIEMFIAAIAHCYAFSHVPYVNLSGTSRTRAQGLRSALLDVRQNFALEDAVSDFNAVAPGRVHLPSRFKPSVVNEFTKDRDSSRARRATSSSASGVVYSQARENDIFSNASSKFAVASGEGSTIDDMLATPSAITRQNNDASSSSSDFVSLG